METLITLTNEGVVTVNIQGKVQVVPDNKFYSIFSNVYLHINMKNVNKDYEGEMFVIKNERDEMITIDAVDPEVSRTKGTQIESGNSRKFYQDQFI